MAEFGVTLEGDELFSALLELAVQNVALQQAAISFMCDVRSKTIEEGDAFYADVILDANKNSMKILESLYERRGKVDLHEILKKRPE